MACNCCEVPFCDEPVLIYDSASVSLSKCGFTNISEYLVGSGKTDGDWLCNSTSASSGTSATPTAYFLKRVRTLSGCGPADPPPGFWTPAATGTITKTEELDETDVCAVTVDSCSGSITYGMNTYTCANWASYSYGTSPLPSPTWNTKYHVSLQDEYTTAALETAAIAALPAYNGIYSEGGDTAGAYRNLSPDQLSLSIRRMNWRLRHPPTSSCYLKVWLRKRFRPEGTSGGSDVVTTPSPYEWTGGTNNPCLSDSSKLHSHADNYVLSDPSEELEPATDGTTTIEIVKWSCVSGYEPDDPVDEFGARPDPDPNPNGHPSAQYL